MTMTDAGLGNRIKVSSPKRVWLGLLACLLPCTYYYGRVFLIT